MTNAMKATMIAALFLLMGTAGVNAKSVDEITYEIGTISIDTANEGPSMFESGVVDVNCQTPVPDIIVFEVLLKRVQKIVDEGVTYDDLIPGNGFLEQDLIDPSAFASASMPDFPWIELEMRVFDGIFVDSGVKETRILDGTEASLQPLTFGYPFNPNVPFTRYEVGLTYHANSASEGIGYDSFGVIAWSCQASVADCVSYAISTGPSEPAPGENKDLADCLGLADQGSVKAFNDITPVCTGTYWEVKVTTEGEAWGINLLVFYYGKGKVTTTVDIHWEFNCTTKMKIIGDGDGGVFRKVTSWVEGTVDGDTPGGNSCAYDGITQWYGCQTAPFTFTDGGFAAEGQSKKDGDVKRPLNIEACQNGGNLKIVAQNRQMMFAGLLPDVEDVITQACSSTAIAWELLDNSRVALDLVESAL